MVASVAVTELRSTGFPATPARQRGEPAFRGGARATKERLKGQAMQPMGVSTAYVIGMASDAEHSLAEATVQLQRATVAALFDSGYDAEEYDRLVKAYREAERRATTAREALQQAESRLLEALGAERASAAPHPMTLWWTAGLRPPAD